MAVDLAAVNDAFRTVYARTPTAAEAAEYSAYPSVQAVLDALYATPAYREQTLPIAQLYAGILGRDPEPAGLSYYLQRMREGGLTFAQVTSCFLQSPEAQARWADASATDVAFVQALYRKFLGREGEQAGIDYYLDELRAGVRDRLSIAVSFAFSPESQAQVADKRFAAFQPPPADPGAGRGGAGDDGDGGDPGPTFYASEDAGHIVQFSGTATGPITVSIAGPGATFSRGGVTSAVVPLGTVTGFQDTAPLQLTAAQFDALSLQLEAADNVSVSDTAAGITAGLVALVGQASSIDAIDATDGAVIVLTKTQFATLTSAKLAADDSLTIQDNSLTAAEIAALGADDKVDAIRAAAMTLDKAQYAAASAKLEAADVITIQDDLLTAEEIVDLAADDKVDAVRAATTTLDKQQYAAVSAKLDARDGITVQDNGLTPTEIGTLGSDGKVDAVRAATMTLDASQFAAAAAKLNAADTVNVIDTAAAIGPVLATLSANAAKVDSIDATDTSEIVLSKIQHDAITSAKLATDDHITVQENGLTGAQIAALGSDNKVDAIRAATMTLTASQFAAAVAKLNPTDTVNIVDTAAALGAALATLSANAAMIDSIDATDTAAIVLAKQQHVALTSAKLATDDQITIQDNALTATEIAALGTDDKVDAIRAATMTLDKTQYAAASAKLSADDSITVQDVTLTREETVALMADAKVDRILTAPGPLPMGVNEFKTAPGKLGVPNSVWIDDPGRTIGPAMEVLAQNASVINYINSWSDEEIPITVAQYDLLTADKLHHTDKMVLTAESAALSGRTLKNIDRLTVTGAAFGSGTNGSGELGGAAGVDATGEWAYAGTTLTYFDGSVRTITLTGVNTVAFHDAATLSFS